MVDTATTTQTLITLGQGEPAAAEDLMPIVYDELRELARRFMASERADHTLHATDLVHEAYLKLIDQTRVDWKGRAHFRAVAAGIMRRLLVDHARQRSAAKRGGGMTRVTLTDAEGTLGTSEADPNTLLALDQALNELDQLKPRHRQIIEMRFFGGLSVDETAHVLGVSPQTVRVDWYTARAWLRQRLSR